MAPLLLAVDLPLQISLEDPYLMAQYAVDEAIRNMVATGRH